jgi:2-dehydro-3-deoxyphosphogluconate aldolase/(4S)-4-hydroxy-2-oxoglutarate aldolase
MTASVAADFIGVLRRARVVPVVAIDRLDDAVPLARALLAGGGAAIEVTLRTPVAWEAAKAIRDQVPGILLGIGTILDPDQLSRAVDLGAQFLVSPGLTPDLAKAASGVAVPYLPGVQTVTEAMIARDHGFRLLKFFPAEPSGGVAVLKAIEPVLPDLTFCPTGGIGAGNAASYLGLSNVACVGGSWIAPAAAIKGGNWGEVERLTKAAMTP